MQAIAEWFHGGTVGLEWSVVIIPFLNAIDQIMVLTDFYSVYLGMSSQICNHMKHDKFPKSKKKAWKNKHIQLSCLLLFCFIMMSS